MRKIFSYFLCLFAVGFVLAACQTKPVELPKGLTAEQIAVLKEEGFVETDDGWKYDLSSKVLFAVNSTQVANELIADLERLAHVLRDIGIHGMIVEGHTDNQGAAKYNQELSEKRAAAVAEIVLANGFTKNQVLVRGWGLSKPVASNDTEQGRSENRRVSIIVGSSLTPI